MTCSCSRKRWELEQETGEREARRDVSLHCTVAGAAVSNVVPESLITLLPCYPHTDTETVFGSQYMRKCEHRAVTVVRTQELLARHGTVWSVGTVYECDYDGSHSSVQCGEGECHCHAPSGATLGTFAVDVTSRGDMSCGCARDTAADLTDLLCDGNGDYKQLQMRAEQEFCVQPRDG